MLGTLITLLSSAPWIPKLLALAMPALLKETERLAKNEKLTKDEKFERAVRAVAKILDEAADDIPGWADLKERKRDRILGALVEIALVAGTGTKKRKKKRGK